MLKTERRSLKAAGPRPTQARRRHGGAGSWFVYSALWLLIASSLLAEQSFLGPEYQVMAWALEDGLPQTTVTAIVQTRDGYIWVGTLNGLAQFDGIRFKVFNAANQPALPSNRITGLFEAGDGGLLICTELGGVAVLREGRFSRLEEEQRDEDSVVASVQRGDALVLACRSGRLWLWAKGKLTALSNSRQFGPLLEGSPHSAVLCSDESGRIWTITANHRLLRFDGPACECVTLTGGLAGTRCTALAKDGAGRIWLGTDQGLAVLREKQFEPVPLTDISTPFPVDNILASPDGGLWIASGYRERKLKGGRWSGPPRDLPAQEPAAHFFGEDEVGNLCIGTVTEGLLRISPSGALSQLNNRSGLPGNNIRCFLRDHEGSEWLGLGDGGLVRLRARRFQPLIPDQGIQTAPILSVCQGHNDAVWLGTDGDGLNCWQMGRLTRYGRSVLTSRIVASVYEDRRGDLWVGALDGGLFRFQANGFVSAVNPAMVGGQITAIFEDARSRLWLGSPSGLISFEDGRFAAMAGPPQLENWGVRCITEDKAGRLWIGTSGTGLLCLEDGEFKSYRRSDGLAHDSVYCVYIDADQTLWIGTEGGLSRWRGGRFANFTTSQGLPDDVICHIAEDQRGCLWCSSRKGVFRVARSDMDDFERQQLKTIPCVTFDQTDGLPSRECAGGSQPSGCTTRDGRLLIPTLKGVAVVRPDAIVLNPLPPPVTIEEVLVDGQDQGPKWQPQKAVGADLAQAAPAPKSAPFLEIPPGRSRLEIHYTALSFVDPHKVRFKLKLEPLERDWVEVGGLRTVNYSYLPPGEYHFMVLACNNDGVWNRQGATLAFTVRPHFYQSSWFMGAATLFVLGAVGGGARYATRRRLQRKLNQLERQHALEKERMRIARDLHDEIGADLTQMTLQGELAQRESLSLPEVRSQVASLTDKTRQLVRSMEEIVWAVNPRNDPLPNFSSYLCFFAQEFLRSTSIRCRLDVMPGLPPVNFSVQERHNFFLAVKEAFHNIVQHSGATEAWLRIQFEESWLTVTVEDNGQGFDPAHNGEAANGLRNMRDRMQKIGGRMELHSAPGVGARICFIVTANCRQATEPAQDHLPSR